MFYSILNQSHSWIASLIMLLSFSTRECLCFVGEHRNILLDKTDMIRTYNVLNGET